MKLLLLFRLSGNQLICGLWAQSAISADEFHFNESFNSFSFHHLWLSYELNKKETSEPDKKENESEFKLINK